MKTGSSIYFHPIRVTTIKNIKIFSNNSKYQFENLIQLKLTCIREIIIYFFYQRKINFSK